MLNHELSCKAFVGRDWVHLCLRRGVLELPSINLQETMLIFQEFGKLLNIKLYKFKVN